MKVSGMGPVARMLFRALALTTVWGAETAFAGAWSCRVLTVWTLSLAMRT